MRFAGILLLWLVLLSPIRAADQLPVFTMQARNAGQLADHLSSEVHTLVMVWSLDCPHCRVQKPQFSAFEQLRDDVHVLGLAIDGVEQLGAIQQRQREEPTSFSSLVTDRPSVYRYFERVTGKRLQGTPSYLFFSPDGKLMSVTPGSLDPDAVAAYLDSL